jgi:hypothetical protein
MKTKFLIGTMAIFFFSLHTMNAQIAAGVKAGVNFASLSGFSGDSRISVHGGLFLNHAINKNWSIQPELLYSGEGQRYISDGFERTIALEYVQIPLMIQYSPINQLYFEVGPQLGLLASARDKGTVEGTDFNVKNDFANTQVGLNVGVGIKAGYSLGFYGRYSFGLTDVSYFDNIVDQSRVGQVGMFIRLK